MAPNPLGMKRNLLLLPLSPHPSSILLGAPAKNFEIDVALNVLLFAVPLAHLLLAPFSKVEESFTLQAAHDVLVYGTPTGADRAAALAASYDHFVFPGAVPRTFVGAVVLAALSQPLIAAAGFARAQLLVRGVLGALNALSLLVFRRGLDAAFGKATGRWWVALVVSQFHLMFYLSRTLPNMFSFGLTTLAAAFLLPQATPALAFARQKQALLLLVFSAAVFRAETALLLGATCLQLLLRRRATLARLVPLLAGLSLGALLLSVPVDSYFWQRGLLWPELAGFHYNVVRGSASAWGTSPWHYYFSSALPRLLLNPFALPLAACALWWPATSRPAADLVTPPLLFVAVYSLQPHKEARFVFYAVPALAAAAALGANYVHARRSKSVLYRLVAAALPLSICASLAASLAMLLVSSLNYPGGDAVAQLFQLTQDHRHASAPPHDTLSVHADVLICMTGLTLFGQNPHGLPLAHGAPPPPLVAAPPLLLFDKTEDEAAMARPDFWTRFDYVLTEDPGKITSGQWRTVGVVQGYDGIELLRPGAAAAGDADDLDVEANPQVASPQPPLLGRGLAVRNMRHFVRSLTGGWYAGPRMAPRIHIMQQVTAQSRPSKEATA